MKSNKIRQTFIDFFESKGHVFVPSSPVVPQDDPTLLFANAGMNQFKPIFLGEQSPSNLRAVNSQKCIRVSGKHNDLEEVGVDTFHHTFFEMLGNWSFGDYYKADAIKWAWELFTEVWNLDKNRLWVTVFEEDEESYLLWPKITNIDPNRVLKSGRKDNFWEMGETGPCGPCSEIHYFIGDDISKQNQDGVNNSDQYWELWNLVFIQNNRLANGQLEELPSKHVDTGAGFERLASVLQGKLNNYSTDLFQPIIKECELLTDSTYKENPVPFQVIADHLRMLSFSIADGAMPGNEGRGYVLRRIIRRAARFGRVLNFENAFLFKLVPSLGKIMGNIFPEIIERQAHIAKIIKSEEESFNETLTKGLIQFEKMISNTNGKIISGKAAFKLYDTYGFPLDLTQQMANEKKLSIDINGFEKAMKDQKKRARKSAKFDNYAQKIDWINVSNLKNSEFIGYDTAKCEATIVRYAFQDEKIYLVLDKTPFYAESGGQVSDLGVISNDRIKLNVLDVKIINDEFVHICDGEFSTEKLQKVDCEIDYKRRQRTKKNHTATHLMHKALKIVLGDHVQQAGSLVEPNYLRFDLTHFEKISDTEIEKIESIVNEEILTNTQLDVSIMPIDQAKHEGAYAMFGEKYGERVRVVTAGDFSKELCGGTHVDRTGDIGLFKIVEESSLASGVRRIVAFTGDKALEHIQKMSSSLNNSKRLLNCNEDELEGRIEKLLKDKKELENQVKRNKSVGLLHDLDSYLSDSKFIDDISVISIMTQAESIEELKDLGSALINKISKGAVVLGGMNEKPMLLICLTNNLVEDGYSAAIIAKDLGKQMGAGGGGRPNMATAGGKDENGLRLVVEKGYDYLKNYFKG